MALSIHLGKARIATFPAFHSSDFLTGSGPAARFVITVHHRPRWASQPTALRKISMPKPPTEEQIEAEVERMKRRNKKVFDLMSPRQQAHFFEIYRETLRHHPVAATLLEQLRDVAVPKNSGDQAPLSASDEDTVAKRGAR